jgi:hypothetical protein
MALANSICQVKFDQNKVMFDKKPVKSNFTCFMGQTFGQWLAEKRRAAGLNRAELAALSRVTRATIRSPTSVMRFGTITTISGIRCQRSIATT